MYIPKNKIVPNLFTNGGEYQIKSTKQEYSGFYYKVYNGKIFTKKNPNELNSVELIPITVSNPIDPLKDVTSRINLNSPNPVILKYLNLKKKPTNDDMPKKIPQQSYPNPTQEDYEAGSFTRYFLVKINTNQYTEVSKEIWDKIDSKDSSYLWEYFRPFTIDWQLVGDREEVFESNKKLTLLAERNLNRSGFQIFLNFNFLAFHLED